MYSVSTIPHIKKLLFSRSNLGMHFALVEEKFDTLT